MSWYKRLVKVVFGTSCALIIGMAIAATNGYAQTASDMPAIAPHNWAGLYVGVNGGRSWDSGGTGFDIDSNYFGIIAPPPLALIPTQTSLRDSGLLGGVQLGYNWRMGSSMLAGVEVDYDWANITGTNSFTDNFLGVLNTTTEKSIRSLGTLRARLGFLPTPNLLLYSTGGLAWGDTSLNNTVTPLSAIFINGTRLCPSFCSAEDKGTVAGWTVGGGFELALGNGISWKTEYLYVDLGSRTATINNAPGPAGNFYSATADFHNHIVRMAISFKLGGF